MRTRMTFYGFRIGIRGRQQGFGLGLVLMGFLFGILGGLKGLTVLPARAMESTMDSAAATKADITDVYADAGNDSIFDLGARAIAEYLIQGSLLQSPLSQRHFSPNPLSQDQQRPRKLLKGEQALLYTSINEHEQSVNMEPLIDGRPLVLVVGSAT